MPTNAVALRIVPSLSVECKFWLQDGVWNGVAEPWSITVQAGSFEQAKSEMASAVGEHIHNLLHQATSAVHAA